MISDSADCTVVYILGISALHSVHLIDNHGKHVYHGRQALLTTSLERATATRLFLLLLKNI